MISRERVLTVLEGGIPDRVPWVENYISNEVAAGVFGHDNFVPCSYSQNIKTPGMIRIPPELPQVLPLDAISYDFAPPRFAKTQLLGGQEHVTEGLIKKPADLKLLDKLPDPDDESLYRPAEAFLARYKGDLAAIGTIRSGPSNTYLSMGIELFCINIISEPDFVREVLWRFSNWTRKVAGNMLELGFDLYWIPDDIGFGSAPMISREHFHEFCVPVMQNVIEVLDRPVVYHSDGNILPLMDDILDLGVAGIANFEPGPMDIEEIKKRYGDRVTLIGNIDLHYTLTEGTPEETKDEVRRRIEALSPGGRYILASANSLPNYVKPGNVKAMGDALLEHGEYPDAQVTGRPQGGGKKFKPALSTQTLRKSSDKPRESSGSSTDDKLGAIKEAVLLYHKDEIVDLVKAGVDCGFEPTRIIHEALIAAMDIVGQKFSDNQIFVPEMLMAANTMKRGLEVVKPLIQSGIDDGARRVMIATVKGDLHDIGKNIVSMMLEGGGFQVCDLGINVATEEIVDQVQKQKPHVLGLSALLTTTMPEMRKVLAALNQKGLRRQVKVIIGGAPLSQKFADEIGADGYGKDAVQAVSLCKRLI